MSSKMLPEIFYNVIRTLIGSHHHSVSLHEPSFDEEDLVCVHKTIQSGWVSYQGEMVQKFEQLLAEYLGMPYVISIVNGTSALFMALKCLGIGCKDEVLVPAITFSATANAVLHVGAIPHFIDSCEKTFGIDFDKLEAYLDTNTFINTDGCLINKNTKNVIKAIIPVYVLGAALDIQRLQAIAKKYHLQVVEDAAEALGSNYGNQKISGFTGVGVLSFNGNKIITTGGGGAVVLQDEELAIKLRHLSTTAKKAHKFEFEHDEIGYNMRLPALNAALGYSQLKKINIYLQKKRELYCRYVEALNNIDIGKMFDPDSYGKSNCWLNAFVLNKNDKDLKNNILDYLNNHGVAARPLWKPLHLLGIYSNSPRANCETSQNLYEKVICLPSSPKLINHA